MSHPVQFQSVSFQSVSFQYDGQTEPLLSELTVQLPRGWTGIVGANGVGKTTILKLATGLITPTTGSVDAPDQAIYGAQRTDDAPDDLKAFLEATDGPARMLRGRLQVEDDWLNRWETLSHGERKRAQIGVVLWQSPALMAIDEPTNHLDRDARRLLESALATFRGVGLLVSHDRELLDSLCDRCLFVDPPIATLRPGGVTQGSAQAGLERESQRQQLSDAKRERAKLERSARKHRNEASRADRKRSKRGLARGDHDAREKINRARLSGKDGLAGKQLRQLDGRLQHARDRSERLAGSIKKQGELGISIPGVRLRRDFLVRLPPGTLPLAESRALEYPELMVGPRDRIGLVGPNGAGKSTLIRQLLKRLGEDQSVVTYLPQEIAADASSAILNYARSLAGELLGAVMTVVSRLGSDPARLLNSRVPSPGEVRKMVLALGIAQASPFLVLDEPTNHLDLPSIECVEAALRACPCGLLLVSHDERFLNNLTQIQWCLNTQESGQTQLQIEL